jgi:hypothetical protein
LALSKFKRQFKKKMRQVTIPKQFSLWRLLVNKLRKIKEMNVDWIKVCTIGLKVLLAVGTGVAVFAGISQATKSSSTNIGETNTNFGENANQTVQNNITTENRVASGLRVTQNSLEKIISIVGAFAVAAESIGSIFGKTQTAMYTRLPQGCCTATPPYYGYGQSGYPQYPRGTVRQEDALNLTVY